MKISLNKRALKDGRISISIEYYRGSEVNEEAKRRYIRSFENLDTYLFDNPKTSAEKKDLNSQKMCYQSGKQNLFKVSSI